MEKISWSRAQFALKPHPFWARARGTRFFRVQIFRGSPLDHENHENITPRKIPAIRYAVVLLGGVDPRYIRAIARCELITYIFMHMCIISSDRNEHIMVNV